MRIHTKLLTVFFASCLALLLMGLAINNALYANGERRIREQMRDQILMAVDTGEKRLLALDEQATWLSVSSKVNLFSLYDREKNMGDIAQQSQFIHWQLQVLAGSFPAVERIYAMFPGQQRQITNRLRYETLDAQLHASIVNAQEGVLVQDGLIYAVYPLSNARLTQDGSLIAVGQSAARLLEEMAVGLDGQVSIRLRRGDETLARRGGRPEFEVQSNGRDWRPSADGWAISCNLAFTLNGPPLALEAYVPQTALNFARQSYWVWTALLALLALIEAAVFILLMRRMVSRPLNKVIGAFDSLAQGDMAVRIHHTSRDEFAALYKRFNEMVLRLEESVSRQHRAEMGAQRAELKQLQTQIQPHFLYNSFYQIYRICRMGDSAKAAEFALLLSGYYEYVTRSPQAEGYVALEKEYEHAQRYARIQQIRFGEKLNVRFDPLCPQLSARRVPRLILQPLLENAVKYNFEESSPDALLSIAVSALWKEGFILLSVEDNGTRLTDGDVEALRERLAHVRLHTGNSGLENVHLRLSMAEHRGGICLSRGRMGGLRVELRIASRAEGPSAARM